MFSHDRIWGAIDALAARHGLTASGLARRAGLDPTAFNKSKRVGGGGRLRWPSTESLSKVMVATGTSPEDLVVLMRTIEMKGLDRPALPDPPGDFRAVDEALEALAASLRRPGAVSYVVPSGGLPPLYREGDRLVLDPAEPVTPGARILTLDHAGNVAAGEVVSYADDIALAIPGRDTDIRRSRRDIVFAARIVWASQ